MAVRINVNIYVIAGTHFPVAFVNKIVTLHPIQTEPVTVNVPLVLQVFMVIQLFPEFALKTEIVMPIVPMAP